MILSYLGLGVGVDQVSWGPMLAEAQGELILGFWWQLAAATAFMAVFVTAFSLFTDSCATRWTRSCGGSNEHRPGGRAVSLLSIENLRVAFRLGKTGGVVQRAGGGPR